MRSASPPERMAIWGNIAAGDDHNFWSMAETGPCGPCSELFYDRGAELSEGPDCVPDHSEVCPRWLEIWNLVFMQFDRSADGTLTPLPFPSVDTGMGLERMTSAIQGVDSNYRTDLFTPIIDRLAAHLGHDPQDVESERFSYQVVADHSRAMTFLIGEGLKPSNEGPGYVLRRIMRRAVRHLRLMGITQPVLAETCAAVIEVMGGAYPYLVERRDEILAAVDAEERKFGRTLEAGSERLAALVDAAGAERHDLGRRGVPAARHLWLPDRPDRRDRRGTWRRASTARGSRRPWRSSATARAGTRAGKFAPLPGVEGLRSEFIGYPNETSADGLAVLLVAEGDGIGPGRARQDSVLRGGRRPDRRPRRAGRRAGTARGRGHATRRATRSCTSGSWRATLAAAETVTARVDEERRWGAARNHTATHLLHRALRDVLGEQAKQAGSWVGPDGLRFDFPADAATPREALREVERRVNAQIRRNAAVTPTEMSLAEAQAIGADMFFGEKYVPERVRVVRVDGYSAELCGGTHVAATGQIGSFRITGEASIGTGLRRIEAVSGAAADELVATRLEALHTRCPAARRPRGPGRERGSRPPGAAAGGGEGWRQVRARTRLDAAGALAECAGRPARRR